MKKVLILSDSHRNVEPMFKAIEIEQPDYVLHLGDHISDAAQISRKYPMLPLVCVPGNCDFSNDKDVRTFTLEGHKIMVCHGHQYHVKQSLTSITYAAREKEVALACFGHTHRAFLDDSQTPILFNPGSIGQPGYGGKGSYGIIMIDATDINITLKYL